MPKGIPNAKPAQPFGGKGDHDNDGNVGGAHEAVDMEAIGHTPAVTEKVEAAKPKMQPVKLLKNYRPIGPFEIVGYNRPAILKKNAAGMLETVEEEAFVEGELPPAAQPGTGFENKLWAGAIIRLLVEEAKSARKAGIAEYEIDD